MYIYVQYIHIIDWNLYVSSLKAYCVWYAHCDDNESLVVQRGAQPRIVRTLARQILLGTARGLDAIVSLIDEIS